MQINLSDINPTTDWSQPEPVVGWIPTLMQSRMPEPPAAELVLSTPGPDDFIPLPPDTKDLVNRMGQEERENVLMAAMLEAAIVEYPEIPEVISFCCW
jgi:hypothetical protein